jgi:hypothetical protein
MGDGRDQKRLGWLENVGEFDWPVRVRDLPEFSSDRL